MKPFLKQALSLLISVLAGLINSQQREWGQWAVGAFAAMLFVAIGGFIGSWQLRRIPKTS